MSDEDKKDNNELFNNFSDDEISELEKMADEISKEGDNSATVPAEEPEDKKDNNELFNNFSDDEISELEKMADEIAKEGDNSATVPAEELEDTSFSQDVPSTGSNDVDEILSKAKELAENQGEIELSENQLTNDVNIVTDIENADNQKEESLPELDANSEFDEAVSNDSEPPSWVSESPPIDEYEGHTFDNSGYTEADDFDKELNTNTDSNSDSAPDKEAEKEKVDEISHQKEPDDNLDSEFQDSNSVDLSAESSTFDTQSHQLNDTEEEVVNDEHFEEDNSHEPQIMLDDELNSDEPAEDIEHDSTETYEGVHQDDSDAFDSVEEDVVAEEAQEILDAEDVSHDSDFSVELNNEGEIDQDSITSTPVYHQEQPANQLANQQPANQQPANQQPAVNYGHQPALTHTKSLMSFGFGSLSALFNRNSGSSKQKSDVGYSFGEHLKNAAQRDIQKLQAMQKEQCKLLDMAAKLTNPKEYDSNNRDRVLGLLGKISEASNNITAQANRLSISTSNMSDVSKQLENNNNSYKADSEKLLKDIEGNTNKLDDKSLKEAAEKIAQAFKELFNKLFSSDKNAKSEMSM
ncbi:MULTISPECIES: hypothetical protein [Pseudoalteromonas]|uniref:hypothetical protein n=1 Tax=Pseudoalteromonas TaxID=53246 RepID=UPI0015823147|nr:MULTISPECIES: hypothetical protein [Pseudoalteromonas]MDI4652583.1 hypothetical protein [Pseudoalteromonas shioyasakiensis]NUJ38709.1 hypothetical protein [Pseudoalteromonas sp. 0303]